MAVVLYGLCGFGAESAWAEDKVELGVEPETAARAEWFYEVDPYYSSVAVQLPLGDRTVPHGGQLPELEVYRQLWLQSLTPQILLLEASVYPLPYAGSWLKAHHPRTHNRFDVGSLGNNRLNLIDAVSAGFQEPWAVSAFLGSSMNFRKNHGGAGNRGYMGYLVSFGAQHLWQSRVIQDPWWELEWKLKGEQERDGDMLSWSFRLGIKEHSHAEIADVVYLGLRRNSLDFNAPLLEWLRNSSLDWLTEFDQHDFRFLRQELTVGYKLPFKAFGLALGVDVGVVIEGSGKYSGSLADPEADRLTFLLRPRLQF